MDRQINILDDHRNMLMVSKNISSFQEKNLTNWAFILFDNLKQVDIKFNFINHEHMFYAGVVKYNLTIDANAIVTQERVDILTQWVRELLWFDTKVILYVNGEKWT